MKRCPLKELSLGASADWGLKSLAEMFLLFVFYKSQPLYEIWDVLEQRALFGMSFQMKKKNKNTILMCFLWGSVPLNTSSELRRQLLATCYRMWSNRRLDRFRQKYELEEIDLFFLFESSCLQSHEKGFQPNGETLSIKFE